VIEYPKIETLFNRDPKTFIVTDEYRCPEFLAVKKWHVTEKIDGTNVRVGIQADGSLFIGGRTDNAQMPPRLLSYLQTTFPLDKLRACFPDWTEGTEIVLFGEGYGPGIQKSGGNYRKDHPAFRLFDVHVTAKKPLWLEQESVVDIAAKLGIGIAPVYGFDTLEKCIEYVKEPRASFVSDEDNGVGICIEGIVARSVPIMLDRFGNRIIFKLKHRDFTHQKLH
jgi:RNA ligase